jgi:hypothetical protein
MNLLKNYSWKCVLFSILLFFSISGTAQETADLKKLVDTTNSFYRSSDLLNLGEIYQPEHVYAKGHPYFITDDYTLASVTVSNARFEKIKARYNIAMDQLIIKARVDSGLLVTMVTKEDRINSFRINDHFFVNVNKLYPDKEVQGYCEEVYKGDKIFYIKYKKKFIDIYDNNTPEGFFSVVKINKYIYTKGNFIPVNKKKDLFKLYGDKKAIKKYLRANKINYSKASSDQLKMLMQFCDGLPK